MSEPRWNGPGTTTTFALSDEAGQKMSVPSGIVAS